MALVLVGGGSRSGKTRFALDRARRFGARLAYVATAQALDAEMRARAARHREERGDAFTTFEEPLEVARLLRGPVGAFDAVVVDCLTLWLNNLMSAGRDAEAEAKALIGAIREAGCGVVLVTNEVGCGIVPANELARRFRDRAGWLNQQIAGSADEVWWLVFGCPLRVK